MKFCAIHVILLIFCVELQNAQFLSPVNSLQFLSPVNTPRFMSPVDPRGLRTLEINPEQLPNRYRQPVMNDRRRVPDVIKRYKQFGTQMLTPSMKEEMKGNQKDSLSDPVADLKKRFRMSDKVIEAASVILLEGYLLPRCRSLLYASGKPTTIFQAYVSSSLCNKVSSNLLYRLFSM